MRKSHVMNHKESCDLENFAVLNFVFNYLWSVLP